jgi:superfamily II DNA or RNA helicase
MLEVRDYQSRIVDRTLQAIEDGHKNVLIVAPTGAGKSLMGHLVAKALHEKYGWTAGWTAMRRHLLAQAEADNRRLLGFDQVKYFSLFAKEPPTGIDVLIEDEAQHSASETSTTLFRTIKPKAYVSMTATPFRTDRMKLCFSKVIHDAGIRQLIDSGWLAPFHQYVFDEDWTPQNVAGLYLADPQRWGKTVMYFLTLAECNRCAQLLAAGGIRCEVVSGDSDQEEQIEAFHKDAVQVLLNVVVLTEGFDAPRLKTVFVRPGSKGPTIQMAGRCFRKHPDKPFAQIVQNSTTDWPFAKIASPEAKFVLEDGIWRTREAVDEKIRVAHANTLLAIPDIPTTMPKYLMHRRKRNRRFARREETF